MSDYGVCTNCERLFILTEEKKMNDIETTWWLCPFCNAVLDDKLIEKKQEWQINFD